MGLLGGGSGNRTQKYNAIRTNNSILGITIPLLFGQNRLAARLIDYNDFTATKAKQQGGKGLGKGGTQYVYTASIIALLAQGPINALLNLWDSTGRFVLLSSSETHTIAGGGGTYTPTNAAIFGNDQGVYVATSYSVGPFTDYGSPGPVTLTGTQNIPMVQVPSSPGAGQYSVNPTTGVYSFAAADAGKVATINYSYYRYQIITQEITVVPFSGPFTVTVDNSTNFVADRGVSFYPSGTALIKVGGSPAAGHYSQSGATYTFNSADTGLGIVINYQYKDPNTNTNAPTTLNLTLVSGLLGQAPLSYMTGKHPSKALGYSQLAYIFSSALYLGFTPELPNYSYEVAGNFQFGGGVVDANPADCILELLTDPAFGIGFPLNGISGLDSASLARKCWTANSFFISPVIENQTPCAHIIAPWLEAGMAAAFWSEGLLKFVPYSDTTAVGNGITYSPSTTPVVNITDDNYLLPKDKAEDPIKITRSAWQDAFNRAQVTYQARVNDYNPEVVYEQDEASIGRYGLRIEDPQQYDFITTLLAAQYAASMRVQRKSYIRNEYTFKLPDTFSYLEPMDVVTINDLILGLSGTSVRITKIEDDPQEGLSITAEDFIWGTAQPAYNPKGVNAPYVLELGQQDPGNTNALVLEAPNRLGLQQGNILYGFVNGSNPNWGGCHVWVSTDGGTNYALLTTISSPSRLGTLTQSLAAFSSANPDNTNTLQVKLNVAGATLATVASSDASNLVSLCAIVNASNALELLSYQTASLVGGELYNLTTLYRGVYGTPGSSHIAGEIFARLDQASFIQQYDPTFYGKTLNFKFTSFNLLGNQEQSLASVTAYSLAIAGTGKGVVALDTGYLNIGAPGYTAYRPLTNPLTATDAGASATINVAAFSLVLAGITTINYLSGAITALAYNTLYYVYFDDVAEVGGSVTYQVASTKQAAMQGTTRFFIGSITTPRAGAVDTIGNLDGGNGAQGGRLNVLGMSFAQNGARISGNGTITNLQNCVDGNMTTFTRLTVTGNGAVNQAEIYLSAPPALNRNYISATLKLVVAIATDSLAHTTPNVIVATGGHNVVLPVGGTVAFVDFQLAVGNTLAYQELSTVLVSNANLSQTWVSIYLATTTTHTSGTLNVDVYGSWIEAVE